MAHIGSTPIDYKYQQYAPSLGVGVSILAAYLYKKNSPSAGSLISLSVISEVASRVLSNLYLCISFKDGFQLTLSDQARVYSKKKSHNFVSPLKGRVACLNPLLEAFSHVPKGVFSGMFFAVVFKLNCFFSEKQQSYSEIFKEIKYLMILLPFCRLLLSLVLRKAFTSNGELEQSLLRQWKDERSEQISLIFFEEGREVVISKKNLKKELSLDDLEPTQQEEKLKKLAAFLEGKIKGDSESLELNLVFAYLLIGKRFVQNVF